MRLYKDKLFFRDTSKISVESKGNIPIRLKNEDHRYIICYNLIFYPFILFLLLLLLFYLLKNDNKKNKKMMMKNK
jgi:hypothetical protein